MPFIPSGKVRRSVGWSASDRVEEEKAKEKIYEVLSAFFLPFFLSSGGVIIALLVLIQSAVCVIETRF